jgi:hemerythrin-like domain-containing protein
MPAMPNRSLPPEMERPLDTFSRCHTGIVGHLTALNDLPVLAEAAERARAVAASNLALFREAVLEHHADEEKELFPAVVRSARPGEEATAVAALVHELTRQHRAIEALWKQLEPAVRDVARGARANLDAAAIHELVASYLEHAAFEEMEFLPLAQEILGRNGDHMAALGLSLHLRHAPPVVPGYI